MGAPEESTTPSSPPTTRGRRSLPEIASNDDPKSPALSIKNRRSFRTSGRSSLSTSSDKSPSLFGSASARSSLRGSSNRETPVNRASLNRGSPSPARKLTTPQGPNLATATRQRQCKCSETHHHGHHGHVTPVVPRVPLERARAYRRSRGHNVTEDSSSSTIRKSSSENTGNKTRRPTPSKASPAPSEHSSSSGSSSRGSSVRNSPTRDSPADGCNDAASTTSSSSTSVRESPARETTPSRDSQVDSRTLSTVTAFVKLAPTPPPKPTEKKTSVTTTMVNWVPWLAEKRYYTSLQVSPYRPIVIQNTVLPAPRKASITEVHHFKVIHTSSTVQQTPSFLTSIGAPPSSMFARLTMA